MGDASALASERERRRSQRMLGSFGERCIALPHFPYRCNPPMGSFRQGVTSCRGFVSQSRFGSFGESSRRYILPWLRFVTPAELGSFRQGVTSCRGFVSQPRFGSFGESVRRYILPWLRFAAGVELGSFHQGVTSCRGFVSQPRFGSFGESTRRYILPWLRFAAGAELGSFRQGVTACHGFVSQPRFGSFGEHGDAEEFREHPLEPRSHLNPLLSLRVLRGGSTLTHVSSSDGAGSPWDSRPRAEGDLQPTERT